MTGEEWQQALRPLPQLVTLWGMEEEAHEFQVSAICLSLSIERAAIRLEEIFS